MKRDIRNHDFAARFNGSILHKGRLHILFGYDNALPGSRTDNAALDEHAVAFNRAAVYRAID